MRNAEPKIENILLILAATWIAGNYLSIGPFKTGYIICFFLIILTSVKTKNLIKVKNKIQIIPILLTLIYLYGVARGLYLDNKPSFVIANFAGLSLCAPLYYLCIHRKSPQSIIKTSILIGKIYLFILLAVLLTSLFLGNTFLLYISDTYQMGSLASVSETGQIHNMISTSSWAFVLVFLYIYEFISKTTHFHKRIKTSEQIVRLLIVLTLLYMLIVKSDSKGFILALVIGMTGIVSSTIIIRKRKQVFVIIAIITMAAILIITGSDFITEIFNKIFSELSSGNSTRYEQIDIVSDRFKFLGNGLGADFGLYTRSDSQPYGLELTYLNLIDKLGILGIFISFLYFWLYFVFWTYLFSKNKKLIGIIGMGITSFIWPSIGNPMLLSTSHVISLLFAIQLIAHSDHYNLKPLYHSKSNPRLEK